MPKASPVPASARYRYSKRRYRALFTCIDAVGRLIAGAARSLRRRATTGEPRAILIVQLDHIGDAVLSTGMIRVLRERFPNAAIDVLAAPWNADIFRGNSALRNVLLSDRNWQARKSGSRAYFSEVLCQARRLRPRGYDLGIDPRGDVLVACLLWLAGVPRRLGWDCGGCDFLLTDVARWTGVRHETESRAALLKPLGVAATNVRPELLPNWADFYAVRELLASLNECLAPIILLHAGAGTTAKQWPVSHFHELVERLARESAGTVILVGGQDDRRRAQALARTTANVVDWTGRLTLMQLAALASEADLFIGGDSGPAHVAATMGTPSIVLFSGTNRSECWRPVGDNVVVLHSATPCAPCHLKDCPVPGHPCMTGILPWEVLEAARTLLLPVGTGAARRSLLDSSGWLRHTG